MQSSHSIQTRACFILFLAFQCIGASAQPSEKLTLADCYALAKTNYPAIKKLDLIARTSEFDLQNAGKRFLPQVSFSGQATYQSQTIRFPDGLGPSPDALPSISKDQYRIQGEIHQLLYDGGSTQHQKQIIQANAALQKQSVEVNLYALQQRINNLFFSVLLADAQVAQNEINKANLQTQVQKAEAALANGVAFRSNVDELKAEVVSIKMMNTEFAANRTAYLKMLSLFIGQVLPADIQLEWPQHEIAEDHITRPELKSFDLQKTIHTLQEQQLKSDVRPQVSAFFQGAYGRPTLNIIDNKLGPWFVTGLRFTWSFGSLYTMQNRKTILSLHRQSVDVDRETFLLNTSMDLAQQDEQVIKYQQLLEQDEQAIALRQSVRKSAEAQLSNGVITTHEYIQKLNAEQLARQSLIQHELQLLQAKHNQKYITGH